MSCGPGKGLEGVTGALDELKGKMGSIASDLTGNIGDLKSQLSSAAGDVMGGLKGMLPTIELPELPSLPDIQLPELSLPEIPAVDSLQGRIGGLLDVVNNPLAILKLGGPAGLQKELDSIKEKFGAAVPDMDGLLGDLVSGKFNAKDLCKQIPNIEIPVDTGKIKEKAKPATAPEKDAAVVVDPPSPPIVTTDIPPAQTAQREAAAERVAQAQETAKNESIYKDYPVSVRTKIGVKRWFAAARAAINKSIEDLEARVAKARKGALDANGNLNQADQSDIEISKGYIEDNKKELQILSKPSQVKGDMIVRAVHSKADILNKYGIDENKPSGTFANTGGSAESIKGHQDNIVRFVKYYQAAQRRYLKINGLKEAGKDVPADLVQSLNLQLDRASQWAGELGIAWVPANLFKLPNAGPGVTDEQKSILERYAGSLESKIPNNPLSAEQAEEAA